MTSALAIGLLAAWALGGLLLYRRQFPKGLLPDDDARAAAERIRRTGRRRVFPRPPAAR